MTFVASTLPFGDHSEISLCRVNEKKGIGQVVRSDAVCLPTMWNMKMYMEIT